MKLSHDLIKKLMNVFGYNTSNDGVCNGYTWSLINAKILGQLEKQNCLDRFKLLEQFQDDFTHLKEKVDSIKKLIIAHAGNPIEQNRLKNEHRLFLEIPAFCEMIEMYQNPELYPQFYLIEQYKTDDSHPACVKQIKFQQNNIKLISPTTASLKLEQITQQYQLKTPMSALTNTCFVLNPDECTAYFSDLQQLFDANLSSFGSQDTVPIKLGTDNHAVAAFYDLHTRQWQFVEINDNEEYLRDIHSLEELVEQLKFGFDDTEVLLFHAMPLILNYQTVDTKFIDELNRINKKHQNLTKERGALSNSRQVNLAYLASKFGDVSILESLIKLGVDINSPKNNGSSPLCIACQNKELEIARLLVSNGAEINHSKKNGDAPLYLAVLAGDCDIVELLLKNRANVNQINELGVTPLMIAIQTHNFKIASLLLEAHADPNLVNKEGITPLEYALKNQDFKIAGLLIEKGANPDHSSDKELTPLINSIYSNDSITTLFLLNKGASPDAPDKDKITPLYWSCMVGNGSTANLILNRSIQTVNTRCESGHTPLLVACLSEYTMDKIELFQTLLKNGADIEMRNDAGLSAFDIAIRRRNPAAIKALLEHCKLNNKDYKTLLTSDLKSNSELLNYLDRLLVQLEVSALIQICGFFNTQTQIQKLNASFDQSIIKSNGN